MRFWLALLLLLPTLSTFAQHHPDPQAPHRARLLQLLLKQPQMQLAQLAAVSVPILVVAGERDVVLEAHTRALARSLPQGEVLILPNATHYAPQEIPEAFNQAVLEFLARP